MSQMLENKLRHHPRPCVTDTELITLIDSTPDSRYSKVKRLMAQNKLLRIRRGLYCLTDAIGYLDKPHPFELAQYIYGPSYISLESALSFHNLIPEAVYTITSVSTRRSNEFQTPLGTFSYCHLPAENFYTGVELITDNNSRFFMATPWKAICDYIYSHKKNYPSLESLLTDLRIEYDDLPVLSKEESALLDQYYHHHRVSRFLKKIKANTLHKSQCQ